MLFDLAGPAPLLSVPLSNRQSIDAARQNYCIIYAIKKIDAKHGANELINRRLMVCLLARSNFTSLDVVVLFFLLCVCPVSMLLLIVFAIDC